MKEKLMNLLKNRKTLIILCCVLALILILMVAGIAYMEGLLGLINRNPDNSTMSSSEYEDFLNSQGESKPDDFSGDEIDPDDVTWGEDEDIDKSKNILNIMLIGQDRRPGEGRSRSDVMILCTINKSAKTLTITSFLRDMYVQIPGYQDDRMNVCYILGGMDLLESCMQKNFGVEIDGSFEVDFNGFMDVIDAIGGVDITLTRAEADYLNSTIWRDIGSTEYWKLREGENHLNGMQALAYSRIRAIDSDFGRTQRQRNVLTELLEEVKTMSTREVNTLLKTLLPLLTTDLTNAEILDYAADILPLLGKLSVKTQRIPDDGTYRGAWIREMSVLVPDLEANRLLLKDAMKD